METVPTLNSIFKYKRNKLYEGLKGNKATSSCSTLVGIEVELEEVQIKHKLSGTWKEVADGSLKIQGKEFVSIPIKHKYIQVELERLFNSFEAKSSSRCSVHVHLNVRDFTGEELTKFLILYMIFEKSLFKFSGNRWKNNYCIPLYSAPSLVSQFISEPFTKWYKYTALNLCPIWGGESKKYGTVEFRHMEGCTDPNKILEWVNIIVLLKIAAKKISLSDIAKYLVTMNTSSAYWWLAEEVFGKWSHYITNQKTFKDDVESCITQTKSIFLFGKKPITFTINSNINTIDSNTKPFFTQGEF